MQNFGKEHIIDLHNCRSDLFNREDIKAYIDELCYIIDMEQEDLHWWDEVDVPEEQKETEPHLIGTSAIQFIRTSNITIHTLDKLGSVYINIFSCKDFDEDAATDFTVDFFKGKVQQKITLDRK